MTLQSKTYSVMNVEKASTRSAWILGFCLVALLCLNVSAQETNLLTEPQVNHFQKAITSYLKGDHSNAVYQIRRHVALHPQDIRGLRLLRHLSPETQRPQTSSRWTNEHLANELMQQATRRYLLGDMEAAEELAERAQKLDPGLLAPMRLLQKIHVQKTMSYSSDPYDRLFGNLSNNVKVSGEFRDAPLSSVLTAFLKNSPQSVIVEGSANYPLTMSFNRLTPAQAFKSMLTTAGYTLEEKENGELSVRQVDPNSPLTKVYHLKNIILNQAELGGGGEGGGDSEESSEDDSEGSSESNSPTLMALQSTLSESGSLNYDPSQRVIVVTDLPDRHEVIASLIRQLDKPAKQVVIHARIVEISDTDLKELGVNWDLDYNASLSSASRPTTFPFFSGHDVLKDIRPPIDQADDEFPSGSINGSDGAFPFTGSGDFNFGRFTAGNLGFDIQLSQILSKSEILSSPSVVAIDGTTAQIQVGERVPIPTLSTDSETGNTVVTGFDEERVGILLEVVPYVLGNGLIQLSVHPEVSAIIGFVGDNNQRPIVSTREVTTQVILKDKTTFVIGGLIRDSEIQSTKKIPFLADIPILGQIFKDRSGDGEKSELVIFITVSLENTGRELSPRELELYGKGYR